MGHYTASMKRVRAIGKIFVIEIREYDLLFGGRPELKAVKAWAGPLEPPADYGADISTSLYG